MDKNILIIGGSGFVGGTLVQALLEEGHHVTLLNRGNKPVDGTSQLVADRNDPKQMTSLKGSNTYDAVIDLSGYTKSQVDLALSNFSTKTPLWIHLSSAAVYKHGALPPSEGDNLGGTPVWGNYGQDKSAADIAVAAASSSHLTTITLRPPYLYGPGNNIDRETFIWQRVLQNQPIIVPGGGEGLAQFLHVADFASFICYLLATKDQKSAAYNIAAPEVINLYDWVATVSKVTGKPYKVICENGQLPQYEARAYFPFRNVPCALDVSKIYRTFNWRPTWDFASGIAQTFEQCDIDMLASQPADRQIEEEMLNALTV